MTFVHKLLDNIYQLTSWSVSSCGYSSINRTTGHMTLSTSHLSQLKDSSCKYFWLEYHLNRHILPLFIEFMDLCPQLYLPLQLTPAVLDGQWLGLHLHGRLGELLFATTLALITGNIWNTFLIGHCLDKGKLLLHTHSSYIQYKLCLFESAWIAKQRVHYTVHITQ